MNVVLLLAGMSVIGVDYGWERAPDGEQVYIIQLEPELLEKLKAGEVVSSEILPEVKGVRRFRIQVGNSPLPKGNDTINVLNETGVTSPSIDEKNTPGDNIIEATESRNDSNDAFQIDEDFDASGIDAEAVLEVDAEAGLEIEPVEEDNSFELGTEENQDPNVNAARELLNPDEAILANLDTTNSDDLGEFYQGGSGIPLPLSTTELLSKTVSAAIDVIATNPESPEGDFPLIEEAGDEVTTVDESPESLEFDLESLAAVNEGEAESVEHVDSIAEEDDSSEELEAAVLAALEEPLEIPDTVELKTETTDAVAADQAAAAKPPVDVEPANTQPWGVLVLVCLLLFGSVGANIYLAYILAGNTRKRQVQTLAE